MPAHARYLRDPATTPQAGLVGSEITHAERQLVADKGKVLATLDATIHLFAPATNPELIRAVRPTRRGLLFRLGEQMRLCLDALREAGVPMSAR